ncbi:MAG: 50S ribosomal protein L13 [Pigeon pea little leaf phytoplasma]|uniref:Large ribosomal subunit protein uL13 n=1 Tax=Candidatus Phytoplasma fabacearum TaxID=2982628 RepID=A0ABU8ZS43_9MOLU|nr:50S ribosomal protein L13 ['Bituminaria bituminosa' little leaf phytoplasma]MDV3154187.1 50S ribosomal protein L13 [Pigeon pea little leaf phytoplasma]MDO7983500.1 50S ribosomal protein L13 ['Bituminaria bituminosa' little leaf phytoplasma]MDO8023792.1 50S ribosomal protein L13 ['Bituminaria bituminosa' little leaf phytoplasma]MDO8030620.1 50S ribosomal protein L13 ['Bituminaria bituminosa' little leaf phytoplasma]MDV3158520.1 50S ribosomal protein L13 [Pigeon pea little leaf phytoplasma]
MTNNATTVLYNKNLTDLNRTTSMSENYLRRKWYIIDANQKILGRIATKISAILMGKHKTFYTPHIDNGDYVIVINAKKIALTGKKIYQKKYHRHSGYPGGLTQVKFTEMMQKFPNRIIEKAVFGMLPKHKLGRKIRKKLFVYADDIHKHNAQNPEILEV